MKNTMTVGKEELLKVAQRTQDEITKRIAADKFLSSQRPLFHLASPAGWINDPNGLSFYKAPSATPECHIFYQYHPFSTKWGPMHWGHSTTKDFIVWKQEPVALAPDTPADCAGCFSGTAVDVDGKQVIAYTGVSKKNSSAKENIAVQNQCIAIGDGKVYKKLSCNPVITAKDIPFEYEQEHFRDPKIWYKNGTYYLAAVLKTKDGSGALVLFSSVNLEKWTYISTLDASKNKLGKMWECPDLFMLEGKRVIFISLQGIEADKEHHFHNGNNSSYLTGTIDESTHTFKRDVRPETGKDAALLDYGIDFYAPETTLAPDGRQIMIGWMHNWDALSTPENYLWTGQMTIPRELFFKGSWLYQRPVKEIESYRTNHVAGKDIVLGSSKQTFPGVSGRHADMTMHIKMTDANTNSAKLCIRFAEDDVHEVSLTFDATENTLTFDRTLCGYARDVVCTRTMYIAPDKQNEITVRCLLDTCSLEVFVDDGKYAFTNVFYTPLNAEGISFEADTKCTIDYDFWQIHV
jgi:beta-fructofuranosidase